MRPKGRRPLASLDLGFLSRRHLPQFEPELLSLANLKALLTTADGSLVEFVAADPAGPGRPWPEPPPGGPSLRASPIPGGEKAPWPVGSGASPPGTAGWNLHLGRSGAPGGLAGLPPACGVSWRI